MRTFSRGGTSARPPSAIPAPTVTPSADGWQGTLSEAGADEEEDEEVASQPDEATASRTLRVGVALRAVHLPEDCDPTSALHIHLGPGPGQEGGAQSEAWVVQLPLEAADTDGAGPSRVLSVALPESMAAGRALEAGQVLAHIAMSVREADGGGEAASTFGLAHPVVGDGRDGAGRIRVRSAAGARRPLARGPPQLPTAAFPPLEDTASIGSGTSEARRTVATPASGRGDESDAFATSGFVEFDIFDPVSGSVPGSAPPSRREQGSELPSRPQSTPASDAGHGEEDVRRCLAPVAPVLPRDAAV